MRNNQPVTQREYKFPSDVTLMSTTDIKGRIRYANSAFVEVSGFTREELTGKAHNIIRHPDMPPEAFEDMWRTLQAGEPWSGLVKNRRKNGDHYWVRANVAPIVRNGRQIGYMSVRTTAPDHEVQAVEKLYARMRDGTLRGWRPYKGLLARSGIGALLTLGRIMNVRARIRCLIALMGVMSLGGATLVRSLGGNSIAVLAVVAASAVIVGFLLEQQIARPLEYLRMAAMKVATGEAQEATTADRVDEIGLALRAINQLSLMFRWLIADIDDQATHVQEAVDAIAHGNQDLASRTDHAAGNVQQTSSSMGQIAQTVNQNADTAEQARQLSEEASVAAQRGGQAVEQVVHTMGLISDSSGEIANITALIDSIAFQTNILALNAAVEAARAGEQGKGFAVVAGEVRSLAARSAEAARQIKTLITDSVERVSKGSSMVDTAGGAMAEIVRQVDLVSGMIESIHASTVQQAREIGQINHAVGEFGTITQQNAVLVQHGASASESLRHQTRRLAEAVEVFR